MEIPEDDVPQEEIDRMFASLYHAHIPKLVDERVLEFDTEDETIQPGDYAEQILTALARVPVWIIAKKLTHGVRWMTRSSDGEHDLDVDEDGGDQLVQQVHYERASRDDLTTTIIGAIAEAEGVSPAELKEPVLYDCVDIAALEDSFFGPKVAGKCRDAVGRIEFDYGEYRVEVKSDGWVSVYGES